MRHPFDSLPRKQATAVDSAIDAEMRKQQVVGVAVGVVQQGAIVHLRGYGYADLERHIPVTRSTLFRWASVSKPLTAVAALQLWEEGRLDLDADIGSYVPEFPRKWFDGKEVAITTHSLLCHQSGIISPGHDLQVRRPPPYGNEDVVAALDTFKESPVLHEPYEQYTYTTYGYMLVSAIVQRAGGSQFVDQVQERIAGPLGMTTLQPDYEWKEIANRAVGYRLEGERIVLSDDVDVSWKLGGGGFLSCIDDMALFASGLLNRQLVANRTEELMWLQVKTRHDTEHDGLGFELDGSGTSLKAFHSGYQEKAKCRLVLYPRARDREAVVIMSNCEWAEPADFSTAVFQALHREETQ